MMGTSQVSLKEEKVCTSQEGQHPSARAPLTESQIAGLARILENLTANPDGLAKTLRGGACESGDPWDATSAGLLRRYFEALAEEMAENRHAIRALEESWSWRLTTPLRTLVEGAAVMLGTIRNCGRGLVEPAKIAGAWQWFRFRRRVAASGLFDEKYYLRANPDVKQRKISPLFHFFVFGAQEGRNPHSLFDVRYYRAGNAKPRGSFTNPVVHYLQRGAYEGRNPHPLFDSSYYLEQNPDVRADGVNPLSHYLAPGIAEGRNPNEWFETTEYLEQHPDVAARGLNPLVCYVEHQMSASSRRD